MVAWSTNLMEKLYPWAVYCDGSPSFIWEGGGVGEEGWAKNEALLFQSTVDIHFQNAHKTHKNCEG